MIFLYDAALSSVIYIERWSALWYCFDGGYWIPTIVILLYDNHVANDMRNWFI